MAVKPIQTFFVPLPQEDLFDSLSTISDSVSGEVLSGIGIAVAAPGTIIYYDHWEDGYEVDVTSPTQSTTEIWGDGDLTNGAAPGDADDIFAGGDVAVLLNSVPIPRDPNDILYDGADRIQASFPIAVTTGSYAEHPGSFLAGAVEVQDTDSWATSYTIPVGEDTDSGTDAFQYTAVHVMAGSDDTTVTVSGPHGTTVTLDRGETVVVRVNQGNTVTSDKPVQAQLVTGDINSSYEMRWYSLTPFEQWSNEYYAPVAEEVGSTGFWFYNPNTVDPITIHYDTVAAGNDEGSFIVGAGETAFIEVDDGADIDLTSASGLRFFTQNPADVFFALSQIDADSEGETFEWGTRLVTPAELTSQVLVGLGIGNSSNNPNINSRSVVWVTPVAAADIHIDFDGDGVADTVLEDVAALASVRIVDDEDEFDGAEDDQDMSGATIWATAPNDPDTPVDIAAAWGQDPSRSGNGDEDALDLGTLIPPLPGLTAYKTAALYDDVDGDGRFDPGDTIEYTITILNFTRVDIAINGYGIIDDAVPEDTTYELGSTAYSFVTDPGGDGLFGTEDDIIDSVGVLDDVSGTEFPLDDPTPSGVLNADAISGFERQTYTFRVVINDFAGLTEQRTEIVNAGSLRVSGATIKDLEVTVPLDFETGIQLTKYTNSQDANVLSDIPIVVVGEDVTWTYEVTNTGNVILANIVLVDDMGTPDDGDDEIISDTGTLIEGGVADGLLAPGETWTYTFDGGAATLGFYRNVAVVTGDPVYFDGSPVAGLDAPDDSDPSAYIALPALPGGTEVFSVQFDKVITAVNGVAGGVVDSAGDVITYQITVLNDQAIPLPFISVTDPLLQGPNGTFVGPVQTGGNPADNILNVGETWTYTGTYTVQQADLDSRGALEPDHVDLDMIDNTATLLMGDLVIDTASAQAPLVYICDLDAVKTVTDVGGKGPGGAVDNPGEVITYKIAVTNSGNRSLTGVKIDDPHLQGSGGTLGAPVESMNANGVLEVGETWTYVGTYKVSALEYYGRGWDPANAFADSFIKNVVTFQSDQGCSATAETSTRMFSGDIICGTGGKDVIDATAKGEMAPTEGGDIILGRSGRDVIDGLGGNDWITGGKSQDKLTGGTGNDSFVFEDRVKNSEADILKDFKAGEDKIVLDSAIFTRLSPGPLDPANFAINKAKDRSDYIIWNDKDDTLAYDKNGSKNGGEKLFAKLAGDPGNMDPDVFFVV